MLACAVLVASATVLTACGKKSTPEQEVRATIAEAEVAVEKKEIGSLKSLVSDKYTDANGQDKRAVEAVLRYYFLRNDKLHLFTRIPKVTIPQKDRAVAVVFVAMAAQPVKTAEELERLRAEVYRFEVSFAREGSAWRVVSAEWRPAQLVELL